jgi:hypothetical protein
MAGCVNAYALDKDKENSLSSTSPSNSCMEACPLKHAMTSLGSIDDSPLVSAERQKEFLQNMCRLLVSCGILWNAASNPQMHDFVSRWIPGVVVQDRQILSSQILDAEVKKMEERIIVKMKGRLAMGQCDD